jgi:hypothetical protein
MEGKRCTHSLINLNLKGFLHFDFWYIFSRPEYVPCLSLPEMPPTGDVDIGRSTCPGWDWQKDKKFPKSVHLLLIRYARHKNAQRGSIISFVHINGRAILLLRLPSTRDGHKWGPFNWHSAVPTNGTNSTTTTTTIHWSIQVGRDWEMRRKRKEWKKPRVPVIYWGFLRSSG